MPHHGASLRYDAYTNVADLVDPDGRPLMRLNGYEPGDPVVPSHSGTTDPDAGSLRHAAEQVWVLLNSPDRPNGDTNPSMSVGDVVVFHTPDGPATFAAAGLGFDQVEPLDDQVLDTDWHRLFADRTGRSDG